MLSGRRLDLLDPSPVDIEISDIAHGLARVARWNGQTHGAHSFSVAEHSVLVTELLKTLEPKASKADLLVALLHDAPEYVVGDLISPFKAAVGLNYKALENRLLSAIFIRFGLPSEPTAKLMKTIKKADEISAYLEAVQLAGFSVDEADGLFRKPPEGLNIKLDPLPTQEAQASFMAMFDHLTT